MTSPGKTKQNRLGFSLLEVIAASALMALALVPALAIFRDGMALSRGVDTQELLLTYGVRELEDQLASTAAAWANGTSNGDCAGDGHASIRYTAVRSDNPVDGGITNRLMNITVTTYHDADNDDVMDASEQRVVMTTKLGRFATYEALSGS